MSTISNGNVRVILYSEVAERYSHWMQPSTIRPSSSGSPHFRFKSPNTDTLTLIFGYMSRFFFFLNQLRLLLIICIYRTRASCGVFFCDSVVFPQQLASVYWLQQKLVRWTFQIRSNPKSFRCACLVSRFISAPIGINYADADADHREWYIIPTLKALMLNGVDISTSDK